VKLTSTFMDKSHTALGAVDNTLGSPVSVQYSAPRATIAVLIVCVDRIIRAGLVATLKAMPTLAVHVAEEVAVMQSETDALAAIDGIDVVVADYESALAMARALRQHTVPRAACSARIMIVSQRDSEADVRRALESGVQGYLLLESNPLDVTDGVVALHRGQRVLGRVVAQRIAESFDHEALTGREIDVLRLVAAGDANKLVAKKLSIALGTVKVHVRSIMGKLGARTRTEAAAVARRRGLVEPHLEVVAIAASPNAWAQAAPRQGAGSSAAYPGLRVANQR
jgi:DNA-binding NarL/FixJ family response regulator